VAGPGEQVVGAGVLYDLRRRVVAEPDRYKLPPVTFLYASSLRWAQPSAISSSVLYRRSRSTSSSTSPYSVTSLSSPGTFPPLASIIKSEPWRLRFYKPVRVPRYFSG
jgi:hypothetical protein